MKFNIINIISTILFLSTNIFGGMPEPKWDFLLLDKYASDPTMLNIVNRLTYDETGTLQVEGDMLFEWYNNMNKQLNNLRSMLKDLHIEELNNKLDQFENVLFDKDILSKSSEELEDFVYKLNSENKTLFDMLINYEDIGLIDEEKSSDIVEMLQQYTDTVKADPLTKHLINSLNKDSEALEFLRVHQS